MENRRYLFPERLLQDNKLEEFCMIRKVKAGYRVVAESGRPMGTYKTLKDAKHRLAQIEMFKHLRKR